jgi:hypothetical protein
MPIYGHSTYSPMRPDWAPPPRDHGDRGLQRAPAREPTIALTDTPRTRTAGPPSGPPAAEHVSAADRQRIILALSQLWRRRRPAGNTSTAMSKRYRLRLLERLEDRAARHAAAAARTAHQARIDRAHLAAEARDTPAGVARRDRLRQRIRGWEASHAAHTATAERARDLICRILEATRR